MKLNRERLLLELGRSRRPLTALGFLALCGAIAGWVIFKNQAYQRPWIDYYNVAADVDDAKGIVPGKQDVRIAGVKVGVITKSELVKGRPRLTLSLEPKYAPLYRDAKLRIRPVTPLQDMFVNIERGTPAAGKLQEGAVLPAESTTTPVDVSRVLQTFDQDTRGRLNVLLREMGPALGGNGPQLQEAFVSVAPFLQEGQKLSTVLADRRIALKRAVTNFGRLTSALGARDVQLTRLIRNGEGTLDELASRDRALNDLLAALPGTLSTLQSSMRTLSVAQGDLDPALAELRPVAAKLEGSLRSLEELGVDVSPAAKALQPALRRLRPLARDLRPTALSLQKSFAELRGQAPSYNTLTREVTPCEPVVRDFFGNTPSVLKFSNAVGAYPRGDLSFAPDSAAGTKNDNLKRTPSCTDRNGKTGGRK